jgi:hypothetical protein
VGRPDDESGIVPQAAIRSHSPVRGWTSGSGRRINSAVALAEVRDQRLHLQEGDMNHRRLISLSAGALLAVTTAIAAFSGSALAAAPNGQVGIACDNIGCCEPDVVGNVPAPPTCWSPSPSAVPTATALPSCGVQYTVVVNSDEKTAEPCATAIPLPSCLQVSVVATEGSSEPPLQLLCPTAPPVGTATPFESIQGETATPVITTPPTNTGNDPSNPSTPFMALLICLAFGAIGLATVEVQRRSANR